MKVNTAPAPDVYRHILGMRVDATSYRRATDDIVRLAVMGEGGYVCVANVHMTMEAYDDPEFSNVVNSARIVTPDGMPLVWALKLLGVKDATRVRGPDLMLDICAAAERENVPVGFYGGTPASLDDLQNYLSGKFPGLKIAVAISPPFRALSDDEEAEYINRIKSSGARILFVGTGCPKQEKWMARHSDDLSSVMLGVGAAFDIFSGRKKEAPRWMMNCGLEWFFRLCSEPGRLWKRYFKHNPRFVYFFMRQLVKGRLR